MKALEKVVTPFALRPTPSRPKALPSERSSSVRTALLAAWAGLRRNIASILP